MSRPRRPRTTVEPATLSLPFSEAEITRLREASGQLDIAAWVKTVVLDLAGDLADRELASSPPSSGPTERYAAPLVAVGVEALVLEEFRTMRDELRLAFAEQRLWLQVLYAEVRAQATYPTRAHEVAACAKAHEELARMKQLVAEKLAS